MKTWRVSGERPLMSLNNMVKASHGMLSKCARMLVCNKKTLVALDGLNTPQKPQDASHTIPFLAKENYLSLTNNIFPWALHHRQIRGH